jgi:hypothetical protein
VPPWTYHSHLQPVCSSSCSSVTDNTVKWILIIVFVVGGDPVIQTYLTYNPTNRREDIGVANIEFLDPNRMSVHQVTSLFSDLPLR